MATGKGPVVLSSNHALEIVKANFALIIFGLFLLYCLNVRYNTPLRRIPGPFIGSLTRLWKVWTILTARQEVVMMDLHKKFGEHFHPIYHIDRC